MFEKEDIYFPIKQKPACQLKWNWSTVWLTYGSTNSCHRCLPVDLDKDNFDNFHNLPHKIKERKIMLSGKWPTVENGGSGHCLHCKKVEDVGGTSDRMHHLTIPNQTPKELLTNPTAVNVTPKILELFVNSTCNMSCVYCKTSESSKINAEAKKFGPIKMPDGNIIKNWIPKPKYPKQKYYFERMMNWIEKNGNELTRLQILGGEPFYMGEMQKIINTLKKLKNPHLELNVFSNFMVKEDRFKSYIGQLEELVMDRRIGRLELTASIDGWGPEAEYARTGLKCDHFRKLFNYAINKKWIVMNTQSVISSLTLRCVPGLLKILNEGRKIRKIGQHFGFISGFPFLHPEVYGGKFWKNDFENILENMPEHNDRLKIQKDYMRGNIKYLNTTQKDEKGIKFLKYYLDTLDKRRNTNWRKIYPYLDI